MVARQMLLAIKCGCVHVYTVYVCACIFNFCGCEFSLMFFPIPTKILLSCRHARKIIPVPSRPMFCFFFFRGGSCFFNNNFTHLTNSVQSFNTATLDSSDLPGSSISVIRGSLSITPTTLLVFEVWRLRHASSFQSTHVMHRSGGSNQRRWEKMGESKKKDNRRSSVMSDIKKIVLFIL